MDARAKPCSFGRAGRIIIVLVAAVAASPRDAPGAGAPPAYRLELIDLFEGDFANTATAINERGDVAGFSNAPSGNHAWRLRDGELEDIGDVGGVVMRSAAINETGVVAGYGNDAERDWVGWVWDGETLTMIPTFGGDGSRAWGINDHGDAVGDAQLPDGVWNALFWDGVEAVNLGTLGGANSQAYDIDNERRIVGFATNEAIEARAVIWHEGEIIELEQPDEWPDSVAYGINESGVAIGTFGAGADVIIPAMWIDGGVHPLPPLPGEQTKSWGWAINGSRQAVGWSQPEFNVTRATTWIDGAVHDLNDLVETEVDITLTQAWDINDDGIIVGIGLMETGPRAFVLTPKLPGDLDEDGVVDFADVLILLASWGPCPEPPDPCPADLDGDDDVGFADLLILLANWS